MNDKPPQSLTAKKRNAILTAALTEFEARGFRETSMDRIAKTAGVSKRTVYNHFSSKEQLFGAIAAELIERVKHVSDYPYDSQQAVDTQLREIGAQILDMLASGCFLNLARVTVGELMRSPEMGRKTHELMRKGQNGLARWLSEANDDGRLAIEDPSWASDQFLGLIKTFALWPQIIGRQPVPDETTRERILDSAVVMFIGQYRPTVD